MTQTAAPVVKIPAALSMLLKSFGADPEKISFVLNLISEKAFEYANDGTIGKIFGVVQTLERIETKLDKILERLPQSDLEKFAVEIPQNGKPESAGS